jgi:hypothetical protein
MSQKNPDSPLRQFKTKLKEAAQKKKESALKALFGDTFEGIDPEGAILGKQQLITAMVSPGAVLPQFTFGEVTSQTLVKGSLIRETGNVLIEGTLAGQEVEGYHVYTALYAKATKDWHLVGVTLTKRSVKGDVAAYVAACMEAAANKDEAGLQALFHPEYYLVDDKGNVHTRSQVIDSVLHSDTGFEGFKYQNALRTDYQYEGDTVREVSEVQLSGKYMNPTTEALENIGDQYIYTATYVRGPQGLQIIANTMTAKK